MVSLRQRGGVVEYAVKKQSASKIEIKKGRLGSSQPAILEKSVFAIYY